MNAHRRSLQMGKRLLEAIIIASIRLYRSGQVCPSCAAIMAHEVLIVLKHRR